MQMKL